MARPERCDAEPAHTPSRSTHDGSGDRAAGYRPGGQVGQMQADLADRLAREVIVRPPAIVLPGERLVRFVSVAGGCLALLATYAGLVLLILR